MKDNVIHILLDVSYIKACEPWTTSHMGVLKRHFYFFGELWF